MKNKSETRGNSSSSMNSSGSDRNQMKSNPSSGRNPSSGGQTEMRNRSSRTGSSSQHSRSEKIDTDGGAPSRQTSEAGSKSGQL